MYSDVEIECTPVDNAGRFAFSRVRGNDEVQARVSE